MEKKIIYAKTLNPEWFDYRAYDIREDEGNEVIIDGDRDYKDIDQKGYLKAIKKLIEEFGYWDYENYYGKHIMWFLEDYLPKKENGKKLSPKEAGDIRVALELDKEEEIVCLCLSIITGKAYFDARLHGCCQGEVVKAYAPVANQKILDWIEAWFFGTGTEVLVYDGDLEPETADDIEEGFTFYTANWNAEDIKREVKEQYGYKADDESVEVKLWLYKETRTIHIDEYELAD